MKKCYYEILEVDSKATASEIKTNYRKLALKHHPDKNSEEGAKQKFVEINQAYNVLSDVNERSWYDQNREKILFNKEEMSKEDIEMYSFGFNIWTYFTVACFKGFDDSEGSFYQVYRDVFEKIKAEEAKSFATRDDLEEEMRKFQGFGDSTTIEAKMLKFYEDWESFSTYKTFIWSEQWDTREANNRWVRRQMQKQNKKQRQTEKKTYIKTVKDLAAFVKKRDPRYRDYLLKLKQEEEKKALEKLEREKQKKKEKQEMKVIKQKMEEQRFKQIEEYYQKQNQELGKANQVHHNAAEEDEEREYYCQICDKQFKSDNQLKNHQKSKQHKQMIKQIEKEVMLKEDMLNQEETEEPTNEPEPPVIEAPKKKKNKKKKNGTNPIITNENNDEDEEQTEKKPKQQSKPQSAKKKEKKDKSLSKQKQKPAPKSESDDDDDNVDFMAALLNNRGNKAKATANIDSTEGKEKEKVSKKDKNNKVKIQEKKQSESDQEEDQQQKLGKAKLKKQKKTQQQKTKPTALKCQTCNESYPSKTKLFEHINKSGHAAAK